MSASRPAWMRDEQPWGGARAVWWNPLEQSSPVGPAFQGQGRWSDPDAWAAAAEPCAPECDEVGSCDGRETVLGVGAAGLGVLGILFVWRWRRRRGSG